MSPKIRIILIVGAFIASMLMTLLCFQIATLKKDVGTSRQHEELSNGTYICVSPGEKGWVEYRDGISHRMAYTEGNGALFAVLWLIFGSVFWISFQHMYRKGCFS